MVPTVTVIKQHLTTEGTVYGELLPFHGPAKLFLARSANRFLGGQIPRGTQISLNLNPILARKFPSNALELHPPKRKMVKKGGALKDVQCEIFGHPDATDRSENWFASSKTGKKKPVQPKIFAIINLPGQQWAHIVNTTIPFVDVYICVDLFSLRAVHRPSPSLSRTAKITFIAEKVTSGTSNSWRGFFPSAYARRRPCLRAIKIKMPVAISKNNTQEQTQVSVTTL